MSHGSQRGFTAALTHCLAVLAALVVVTIVARADSGGPVPVVACSLQTMLGPEPVSVPETAIAVASAEWRARLAFYSYGGTTGVYGPRNWYCHAHSGTGGSVIYITPDPGDPFSGSTQRGRLGLTLLDEAGYGGHAVTVLESGAPLFANLRALARRPSIYPIGYPGLTDKQMEPIANEQVMHESATRATFCDPPGVHGSGVGSGGAYPSCGVAVEHMPGNPRGQVAPDLRVFSVTLSQQDRAFMDLLVTLNGAP